MKLKSISSNLPEQIIERQILMFLKSRRIFAWKVRSTGTFDAKQGRFRKASPYFTKGCADILALFNGKLLAIEVKSAKGKLSDHQKEFLHNVNINGGYSMIARSIEDVEAKLKHLACLSNASLEDF